MFTTIRLRLYVNGNKSNTLTGDLFERVDWLDILKVASVGAGSDDESDAAFLLLPSARHQTAGRIVLQDKKQICLHLQETAILIFQKGVDVEFYTSTFPGEIIWQENFTH